MILPLGTKDVESMIIIRKTEDPGVISGVFYFNCTSTTIRKCECDHKVPSRFCNSKLLFLFGGKDFTVISRWVGGRSGMCVSVLGEPDEIKRHTVNVGRLFDINKQITEKE